LIWFLVALAVLLAALVLWAAWVSRGIQRWVPMDGQQIEVPGAHRLRMAQRQREADCTTHRMADQ